MLASLILAGPGCDKASRPPPPPPTSSAEEVAPTDEADPKPPTAATATSKYAELIEHTRGAHDLPAIGVAVMSGTQVRELDVSGVRSKRNPSPVTTEDKWHLGSNTKAMTATMVAMMVDEGELDWDTPVAELFAEISADPAWRAVTLRHLLDHRAGLEPNLPDALSQRSRGGEEPRALRAEWVADVLSRVPTGEVGNYAYSNAGYTMLGALLETRWDAPYAELIDARLWTPLQMSSCGLGGPGSDNARGHAGRVAQGPGADNPAVMSPAGAAHCALADYAKFLQLHLRAEQGEPRLLAADSFERLHTPAEGHTYAGGWRIVGPPDVPARLLGHDGSNTLWYASAALFPESDLAIVVITNVDPPAGPKAIPALLLAIAKEEINGEPTASSRP